MGLPYWQALRFSFFSGLKHTESILRIDQDHIMSRSDKLELTDKTKRVESITRSKDKLELTDKTKRVESITRSKESTDNLSITHEIECPRCHDTMILCSEFKRLCYFCEECGFCLALST